MIYTGYFKAYETVELPENATPEEIQEALANSMSFNYFTTVYPEDVTVVINNE